MLSYLLREIGVELLDRILMSKNLSFPSLAVSLNSLQFRVPHSAPQSCRIYYSFCHASWIFPCACSVRGVNSLHLYAWCSFRNSLPCYYVPHSSSISLCVSFLSSFATPRVSWEIPQFTLRNYYLSDPPLLGSGFVVLGLPLWHRPHSPHDFLAKSVATLATINGYPEMYPHGTFLNIKIDLKRKSHDWFKKIQLKDLPEST